MPDTQPAQSQAPRRVASQLQPRLFMLVAGIRGCIAVVPQLIHNQQGEQECDAR